MIRHIYQYELDFACTSASGTLYTLAKEKLNMSTFTKTLIASAMAVAVAGPAAADVPDGPSSRYVDANATVKITPSGCKNFKEEFNAVVGFGGIDDFGWVYVNGVLAGHNYERGEGKTKYNTPLEVRVDMLLPSLLMADRRDE